MSQCWDMPNETNCWLVLVFCGGIYIFLSFRVVKCEWYVGFVVFEGKELKNKQTIQVPLALPARRPHWNSWGRRWRSLSANQNRLSEVNAQTPLLIWFFYSAASLFGSRRNYPKSDLAKLAERLGHPSHAQRSRVSVGSFPQHLLLQIHFRQIILSWVAIFGH